MNYKHGFIVFTGAAIAALVLSQQESASGGANTIFPAIAMRPSDYVRAYLPYARTSELATGVPALVTLAQGALESGWGKHAPGYNFFGIKPGKSWKGKIQYLKTWECGKTGNAKTDNIKDRVIAVYPPGSSSGFAQCAKNGKYSYRTESPFRAYNNPGESFTDHGKFLRNNSRYAAAFTKTNPEDFARAVAAGGYAATTPGYADLLVKLIKQIRSYIPTGRSANITDIVDLGFYESGEPEKAKFPIRLR